MRLYPLFPASALLWCACSLSLEDPELEARKKLAKQVTPSWELLEGRWIGDSTYTLFDTRAQSLDGSLMLDFLPDSSFLALDTGRILFPRKDSALARLSHDTLYLRGGAAPETLLARMRFLGNWLELVRSSDHRSTHFHKLKPIDSPRRDSLLDSGTWIRRAWRPAYDSVRHEELRRDFDYLRFAGDSLFRDTRRNGLSRNESGPLKSLGRRFEWSPPGGVRSLSIDLFHPDSLRFWIMDGGRTDSGFQLYFRTRSRHPFDLDMTPYAAHLRTDTLRAGSGWQEAHFGRYFDLVLDTGHKVSVQTNMPGMPRYRSWGVDSGRLWMEDGGGARMGFSVEPISAGRLKLLSGIGAGFSLPTTLAMTVVDGSRFAHHPLERFDRAGYLHVVVATDTLAYYFLSASRKGAAADEHELARLDSTDTLWASWRMDPSLETYGSGQSGFFFAIQGRTAALGRFTCRSLPSLDLAIRAGASGDPDLARGLLQGACRIVSAEKPPADSNLAVTGEFRSLRRSDILRSPLWRLP